MVNNVLPTSKKLARQISICSQINDLKDIAISLDEVLMNKSTVFHTIGEGTEPITDKNDPVTEIK
ncbi:MAG: hypothetical protein MJ223_01365 [Mycoplasmoidaceae bacterium]|nr:hypothetical protein [Mycoplasmoidaceae bacterium]